MSAMSDYLENKLVDHIFRAATFSKPTSLYISLHTAATSDDGTGAEVTTGVGYARVAVGPSDTAWNSTQGGATAGNSSGTGGLTDNAAQITFGTPTGSWGSVVNFGIWDNSTGGNMLFHGALTAGKNVGNGDPAPYFAAGALDITFA